MQNRDCLRLQGRPIVLWKFAHAKQLTTPGEQRRAPSGRSWSYALLVSCGESLLLASSFYLAADWGIGVV
jgi:hypothetical protein